MDSKYITKLLATFKKAQEVKKFLSSTNKTVQENKVIEAIDVKKGIASSAKTFYGGLLALFLSVALKSTIGLSIEEVLGAIILGYGAGKFILHKIIPRFVKSVKTPKGKEITKTNNKEAQLFEDEKNIQKYGKNLSIELSNKIKTILTMTSIIYFLTHIIAPLLGNIGPFVEVIALFIPGVQLAAMGIFVITAIYVVAKRVNEYRTHQRRKRRQLDHESQLKLSKTQINEHEVTMSKNTFLSVISITLMNIALATLQISTTILGTKIVMPLASILLFSFIAAYTLFFAIPKGIYTIRLSINKINVDEIKLNSKLDHDVENEQKISNQKKISLGRKLDIATHKANMSIGIATLGIVSHHLIQTILMLPFIQNLAIIATGYIAALSLILVAIPRQVNTRNLRSFKQSQMYANVQSVIHHGVINDNINTDTLNQLNTKEELQHYATKLVHDRPDIVIAALLTSLHNKQDENGNNLRELAEKTIIKKGFRYLDIAISKLDQATLQNIFNVSQDESVRTSKLAGPYKKIKTVSVELLSTKNFIKDDNRIKKTKQLFEQEYTRTPSNRPS